MSQQDRTDVFEGVLPKAMQTIRAASSLAAQDVNFYKSVDSQLSTEIDNSARKLMHLANKFMNATGEETLIQFGKDNVESETNWKPISNVLDSVFEKIDFAFDQATKKSTKSTKSSMTYLEDSNESSVQNSGKRIRKPQVNFKVAVDNSESSPFRPKITSKPNSLKSYEESTTLVNPEPIYEESVEIIDPPYYSHPYEYEIDSQPYPESILVKSDPIPSKDWNTTSATWVDTTDALHKMIQDLHGLTALAVDLEHHDFRSYYGIVCLMQISNRDQDWIVDTIALRDDLEPLNVIFTDPNIVKVFHGAFMDIIWLQRDLGLYIVSLFDTYHASRALGFPKFSLAYLLETFANFKTSKKYQLADWRIRPLIPAMMSYARSDTHFLLNIFDQLKNKLIDSDEDKLKKVLYESRQVAKRRFEFTKYRPLSNNKTSSKVSCPVMSNNPKEPYSSIMYQYNVPRHRKNVVETLYNWRDLHAKTDDESVRYVMSNQLLVNLANLNQPVDVQKVLNCASFVTDHVRLNAKELADLLELTLKESTGSDWESADQWDRPKSDSLDDENIDVDSIIRANQDFDKISQYKQTTKSGKELLVNNSTLFMEIFGDNKQEITLEYNAGNNVVIRHNFRAEYNDRVEAVSLALEEFEEKSKIEIAEPKEDIEEETEVLEEEPVVPQEEQLDPNEVITLRNKKSFHNSKNINKKPVEVPSEPAVDYANADKILLDNNKRWDARKEKNKKRSFNPFIKESEGPQGSKKSRRMNSGKSSTFSNKKR